MAKISGIEKVKPGQPRKRRRNGGRTSTGTKVLAGVGGAVVGGGAVGAARPLLSDYVDARIVDLVGVLVGAVGAVATKDWLRSAFIGEGILSLLLLIVDQVKAMKEAKEDAADADEEDAELRDVTGRTANADRPSKDLIASIKEELRREGTRNAGAHEQWMRDIRRARNN